MRWEFSYGRAGFWVFAVAIAAAVWMGALSAPFSERRPDLVLVTFAPNHVESYRKALAAFEARHKVRVRVQVVHQRAITQRMQNAMMVGGDEVPDVVEIPDGSLSTFARGPLEDVGFVDLTERMKRAHLDEQLVASRVARWCVKGHVFALPHDVHPVMLCYRRDVVEQLERELGFRVADLDTWEKFSEVGRKVTRDLDGDGIPDRYMIDLMADGAYMRLLLLQAGGAVFDAEGRVAFDDPRTARIILWYVRSLYGKDRIAFGAGWGQTLAKSMLDPLALFYIAADWRTQCFQEDVPRLTGKLALMPLPAWARGGARTSVWGGTGLAITKACRNQELAWELAMCLYYDRAQLGQRFDDNNLISPLKSAWDLPQYKRPRAYYSGQAIGRIMAELAPQTPIEHVYPFTPLGDSKLGESFMNVAMYYRQHGEEGIEQFTRNELHRAAQSVRDLMQRDAFVAKERP